MNNRAAIYPLKYGYIVIVHVAGAVWTRHYAHDLPALSDLYDLRVFSDDDTDPFTGEFRLPDVFDTGRLYDAGFHRTAEMIH